MTEPLPRYARRGTAGSMLWLGLFAALGAVAGLFLGNAVAVLGPVLGSGLGAALMAIAGAGAVWLTDPTIRGKADDPTSPPVQVMTFRLGVVGGGNMAEAIVRGIVRSGALRAKDICVADPVAERRTLFSSQMRVRTSASNAETVAAADVVVLAVKPQMIPAVMAEIGPLMGPRKLLISIVAGTTIARLASSCPAATRIVRTMPNTPMLVGRGMVAMSPGGDANAEDLGLARALLGASARVIEVPEEKLDAVTAVSGSGPAYFFLLVEALMDAARQVGLSDDEARILTETTFRGAAELLASGDVDAAELRRRVTSPGGTTAAAISSFEADAFAESVARAVRAARDRSRELAEQR
ncbi:MAG: pyrroline-5-carboxylate reductase [Phycisphaerae bacterium]|nr:pyrroline-5-carboxylate reductase [Phycisphaerae bacterium]